MEYRVVNLIIVISSRFTREALEFVEDKNLMIL